MRNKCELLHQLLLGFETQIQNKLHAKINVTVLCNPCGDKYRHHRNKMLMSWPLLIFFAGLDRECLMLIKVINQIWDKLRLHCVDWKPFLLLQAWTMQLVLRTAAVEEGDGASLLSSLHPRPGTSHVNSVTVCVLLHHTATVAWGRGMNASAAQTQSRTPSANLSVLLPVQTPMLWRYAAHRDPESNYCTFLDLQMSKSSFCVASTSCFVFSFVNTTFRISFKPSYNLPTTSLCGSFQSEQFISVN